MNASVGREPTRARRQCPANSFGGAPELPKNYLPRAHLWQQLDRAAEGAATMLVAPSGAGKTLAAAGWIRDRFSPDGAAESRPSALWLGGSPGWEPDALSEVIDQVTHNGMPDSVRKGKNTDRPTLIAIDDAHQLPIDTIRMIERRLSQDPGAMRLLLLTRWDLLQSSLPAELLGDLTVIRGRDLRLDPDECKALIRMHVGDLGDDGVNAIADRLGGWCATTVLASRTVAASADPVEAAHRLAHGNTGLADRVMSEVFATLPSRQRHVLLCVAGEEYVTDEIAQTLTCDPEAGTVLAELADAGLLVTDVARVVHPDRSDSDTTDGAAMYRIEPLLAEVVRRRLAARGVDTDQARATVMLAVQVDLAQGNFGRAFDRMVAMRNWREALALLDSHGQMMIFRGQSASVTRFLREHPDLVESDPEAWMPTAIERWLAGDTGQACYWMERRSAYTDDPMTDVDRARVALMRSRLGMEPMDAAVEQAQELAIRPEDAIATSSVARFAHMLVELGATQNWTGQLKEADQNLTAAIGFAQAHGMRLLSAMAMSCLAFTKYMSGHEHGCAVMASRALEILARQPRRLNSFIAARASLAAMLARAIDVPWLDPSEHEWSPRALHPADLCERHWSRACRFQTGFFQGKLIDAAQASDALLEVAVSRGLPDHLGASMWFGRAFTAALNGDADTLRECTSELRGLDRPGQATLLDGMQADLTGDSRRAVELFGRAVDQLRGAPFARRALALACRAQLLDALGEHDRAIVDLRAAASDTSVQRNAFVFLGWTRHGTPMQTLLKRLSAMDEDPWTREIADAMADRADFISTFLAKVPTARERAAAVSMPIQPKLSSRELDVLRGLARGATYADIGADLFLSENTIKTHVSSLYAKLGVSRRSDALTVGRGLNLL